MRTKFVTAFYTDIKEHPYYGHIDQAREDRYLHSLRVLNNMGAPIVCYVNETQKELVESHKEKFILTNVEVRVSNLSENPFASRMLEIKNNTQDFRFRHEVDWNKIYLLQKTMYDNDFNYLYWIDVGLSHHGLFPDRCNPNAALATGLSVDFNTYSFTNIFNENLPRALNNYSGKKLLNIKNTLWFHNMEYTNRILGKQFAYDGISIGGIIGGHASKINWLIYKFNFYGSESLSKNSILNHEAILSVIEAGNPEMFNSFIFDTWYHENTPNEEVQKLIKNQVHFTHFFDHILNPNNPNG